MAGELKYGRRVEDLKFNDRVKKKTVDYVNKFMAKYEGGKEQKSPPLKWLFVIFGFVIDYLRR